MAQGGPGYTPQVDIPARPTPPRLVNDYTGTLSSGERDALERKLVAFNDSTSTQIAVVLVPTTDGVAPVDYATEILRAWGVGQAGLDNGVVLLVATEDRELFITTGFGAEGALTDARSGRIVRDILVPSFRQGQFFTGIDRATDSMMAALAGEFEVFGGRRIRDTKGPGHVAAGYQARVIGCDFNVLQPLSGGPFDVVCHLICMKLMSF